MGKMKIKIFDRNDGDLKKFQDSINRFMSKKDVKYMLSSTCCDNDNYFCQTVTIGYLESGASDE